MKIAQIGQKAFSPNKGGIERHVCEISKSLAQQGHKILFYSHQTKNPSGENPNIQIIPIPTLETKHLATPLYVILASFHAVIKNPDIIHYHGIGPGFFSIIPRLLSPRTKIIATAHSQDYTHGKWGLVARYFLKIGEYITCKVPDKTTTVAPSYREQLEKKYKKKIKLIPNGAKIPEVKDSKYLEKWGLGPGEYILTVNRLVEHKEIHTLIKAFKNLPDLDKKLIIVGGQTHTREYKKRLLRLAKKDERIIFTGPQKGDTLASLYQHAWLFVQPSRSEGLSTVILEAMAAGAPVLASNITPNKFLIKDSGFTFETKNPESLARQIQIIQNFPPEKLTQEQEKVIKIIEKKFTWSKIGKKVERLYKKTLPARSETLSAIEKSGL